VSFPRTQQRDTASNAGKQKHAHTLTHAEVDKKNQKITFKLS